MKHLSISKNKDKKISVVIPARNSSSTIKLCLSSIFTQTRKPLEIIVVDNNSDDETKNTILEFQKKYSYLKYIFEAKIGRASARNAGIRETQGEIIAMIDADCIAPPNWLEHITQPIREENEIAVMGFEESANKNYWSKIRQEEDEKYVFLKFDGKYVSHLDTKNFAIQASVIKKFMFNPELKALEDWELFLRLKKHNIPIRFLPRLKVRHFHNNSFKKLIKTQYERARNMEKVFFFRFNDPNYKEIMKNDEISKSHSLWNFVAFIPWCIVQVIKNPRKALFYIISDFAWKVGIILESIYLRFIQFKLGIIRKIKKIQLQKNEILSIYKKIKPPINMLVFGLGNDSIFWHKVNKKGKTVFLEDNPEWIQKISKKFPQLEAYYVKYDTKMKDWKSLLGNNKKLEMDLPSALKKISWDLIIVDGPAGYDKIKTPGRMKSIFTAFKLAKKGGIVFVHDSERKPEEEYGKFYFGEEAVIEEVWGRALLKCYLRKSE